METFTVNMFTNSKLLKHSKIIICALAAAVILFSLLIAPCFGKADDSSFYNVLVGNGLYSVGDNMRYFETDYGVLGSGSTAFLPITAAKALSKLFCGGEMFDIRFLAAVYLPAYLIGMFLIINAVKVKNRIAEIIVCILAALILCDIGYISYLNSFYTDAMYISALTLVFGSVMYTQANEGFSAPCLVLWLIGAILLACMGVSGMIAAVLSGILLAFFAFTHRGTKQSFAIGTAIILVAVSLFTTGCAPDYSDKNISAYDALFGTALQGGDVPAELAEFGIPEKYAPLTDKTYFEAKDEFMLESDTARQELFDKITPSSVALFYLRHPSRFWQSLKLAAQNAPFITQEYIPYKQNADYGIKPAPGLWGFLRRLIAPTSIIITLILYAIVIAMSIKDMKKQKTYMLTALFAVICGIVFLCAPIFSGGLASISRRLVLYQISTDFLLLISIIWLINTFIDRGNHLRKEYGVRQ